MKKNITFFSALTIVMGTVIGAGVFFKTAAVTSYTHSTGLTLLAWLLGGLLTLAAGLTVAELATMIPETGGAVKYLEESYHPLWGFLLGWGQTLLYYPANIAALSMIFATQMIHLFQFSNQLLLPISIITVTSITGINILGTKVTTKVQNITLLVKLIPVILIVVASFFTPSHITFSLLPETPGKIDFSGALLATLFAYDGWLGLGAMAGEMKNPAKDLPKAIILGITGVTVVYLLINWGILKALPLAQIMGNDNATSQAATQLLGNYGGKIVTVGLLISVYGSLNGYTLSSTRIPYALAVEKNWPFNQFFKKLSKTDIPYRLYLSQLFLSIFMMLLGSFDLLSDIAIFIVWAFSILLFLGVIVLRKKAPEKIRPYKVPAYPLIPLVATLGASFIIIMTIITRPFIPLVAFSVTLLGVPVYYYLKKKKS